jgi:cysteine desulfuration protein SufE
MAAHCGQSNAAGNALSLRKNRGILFSMTPAARQTRLAQELLRLEDPQERLSYVQDRIRRKPPLPLEHRTETNRIQGCLTKVWLLPALAEGRCVFEVDSESAMVRGLAELVAEPFSGATPREISEFRSSILELCQLDARITPTRRQGLAHLEAAIRAFAASCLSQPEPCA